VSKDLPTNVVAAGVPAKAIAIIGAVVDEPNRKYSA
jgi:acetyltransferase-like isoleucine patch superfamily enzyme